MILNILNQLDNTGDDPRTFTRGLPFGDSNNDRIPNPNPIFEHLIESLFGGNRRQSPNGNQDQESNDEQQVPQNDEGRPNPIFGRRGYVMVGTPGNPLTFTFGDEGMNIRRGEGPHTPGEPPSLSDFLSNSFQPRSRTQGNENNDEPNRRGEFGPGIGGYLQDLLGNLFNNMPNNGQPQPQLFFGPTGQAQFGDYILSQSALDRFIDQLMQQQQPRGPPPASEESIKNLPRIQVGSDWFKNQDITDCSVCKDEFEIDQTLVQMPCKHSYHPECIEPWLKTNGTCPICRYSISMSQDEYDELQRQRREQNEQTQREHDPTFDMPGSFNVSPDELD